MTSGNNDTLYAGNKKQNQPNEEKTKTKNAMIAKILAGTGAGILAGAGAAYAANHITSGEELAQSATEEENQNNNSAKNSNSSTKVIILYGLMSVGKSSISEYVKQ